MKINEENPDSLIFYKYINFLDNHKNNKLFNKIDNNNENDKKRYVKDVISYTENLIKKNSSKPYLTSKKPFIKNVKTSNLLL